MLQKKLRVIHIEDEQDARIALQKMIEKFIDNVEVVATADNLENGMKLVAKNEFDILFLDLQLPDGNGLYILEKFKEYNYKTILTTADDTKGIKALKLGVGDYLVKPYSINELQESIEKQRTIIDLRKTVKRTNDTIIIPDITGMRIVNKNEIIRFEANGNYTKIHLKNIDIDVLVSKTLKYFENQLGKDSFLRIHNSHIVNTDYITRINKNNGGCVQLVNGDKIKTSLNGKKLLKAYFRT